MIPTCSIIVPVYNNDKYLKECLDSILAQTLKSLEIICIDDGSTDKSADILDSYAKEHSQIKVFHNKNYGYGYSINFGITKASGEYIGIVESDDMVLPEMFETLYNAAVKNCCEIVKSNFYYYWSNSKRVLQQVMPLDSIGEVFRPQEKTSIFWSMPCIWTAIYKRTFLVENNIKCLETLGASYQDTAFNFKAFAKANSAFLLNDAFLLYRQDNETSSVKSASKTFCVCDEYAEIEKFARDEKLSLTMLKLIQRLKLGCYMWNFKRLKFPNKYLFAKVLSKEYKAAMDSKLIDTEFFTKKEIKRLKKYVKHPLLVSLFS